MVEATDRNFIRLRGLPYSATVEDIKKFFGPEINIKDVHIVNNTEGRPSGEAYVHLESNTDLQLAQEKDHEKMDRRYIEIFTIGDVEIDQVLRRMNMKHQAESSDQGTIRVFGLPFTCKKEDLVGFFKDMDITEVVFGKEPGNQGRATGEAYVKFGSKNDAERALGLNKQYLGNRYLEIYRVDNESYENFKDSLNAPASTTGRPRPLAEVASEAWSQPQRYGQPPMNSQPQARKPDYSSYREPAYGGYEDPYSSYSRPIVGAQPVTRYGTSTQYGSRNGNPPYDPYAVNSRSAAAGYGSQAYSEYPPQNYEYSASRPYAPTNYSASEGYQGRFEDSKPYAPRSGNLTINGEVITKSKLHMRGLPFRVKANEIQDFFAPLECVEIKIGYFADGRASGDGIVEFRNEQEANEALSRDRNSINNRYIELFPHDKVKMGAKTSYRSVFSRAGSGGRHDVAAQPDPKPYNVC